MSGHASIHMCRGGDSEGFFDIDIMSYLARGNQNIQEENASTRGTISLLTHERCTCKRAEISWLGSHRNAGPSCPDHREKSFMRPCARLTTTPTISIWLLLLQLEELEHEKSLLNDEIERLTQVRLTDPLLIRAHTCTRNECHEPFHDVGCQKTPLSRSPHDPLHFPTPSENASAKCVYVLKPWSCWRGRAGGEGGGRAGSGGGDSVVLSSKCPNLRGHGDVRLEMEARQNHQREALESSSGGIACARALVPRRSAGCCLTYSRHPSGGRNI